MERFKLTGDRAFEFMMRRSQEENIKLRDIAAWLVEHRADDEV